MLYDRWRLVAREFAHEIALRDLPSGRRWTFAELQRASEARESGDPVIFPRGNGADFVLSVLRAWRHGQIVCPLEGNQPAPVFGQPPSDVAHVKLTSATSGPPKLILFTAEQLAADAANIVSTMGLRPDWPNLAFISLAHSYGFSNLLTPLLLHGVPLILGGAPFPEAVRQASEQFPALTVPSVPALWRAWHEANAIPASVRLAISAGAPLPLALERDLFAQCGLKVHNFYGASECGGIAYDNSATPRVDNSHVGSPMHHVKLSVGANGCLEVRSDAVGARYWPDAQPALASGVYRSSDLAELRGDAVHLLGRIGDVIHVAGRKVSPETIEALIAGHAGVRDCLVFGVASDDAQRGETIVACLVSKGELSGETLRQFLLARAESWQVPRDFWFVESLAPNARGKLSRAEWRQRYLERGR
jgi:acyl-CoA synthetase (AMP-forming)/AMP-acid ligase II